MATGKQGMDWQGKSEEKSSAAKEKQGLDWHLHGEGKAEQRKDWQRNCTVLICKEMNGIVFTRDLKH